MNVPIIMAGEIRRIVKEFTEYCDEHIDSYNKAATKKPNRKV